MEMLILTRGGFKPRLALLFFLNFSFALCTFFHKENICMKIDKMDFESISYCICIFMTVLQSIYFWEVKSSLCIFMIFKIIDFYTL